MQLVEYEFGKERFSINEKDSIIAYKVGDEIYISKVELKPDYVSRQHSTRKSLIDHFQQSDKELYVVKLTWDFRGEIITTKCIISTRFNCVVYDPIITLLVEN